MVERGYWFSVVEDRKSPGSLILVWGKNSFTTSFYKHRWRHLYNVRVSPEYHGLSIMKENKYES